jgi:hypothetical protein
VTPDFWWRLQTRDVGFAGFQVQAGNRDLKFHTGQHDLFTDVTIDNDPGELVRGLREVLRSNGEYFRGDGGAGNAA